LPKIIKGNESGFNDYILKPILDLGQNKETYGKFKVRTIISLINEKNIKNLINREVLELLDRRNFST